MQVTLPVRPPVAAPLEAPAPRTVPATTALATGTTTSAATPAARDGDGGLFFKAVFRSFARLSDGSGAEDGTRVVAQQKVKIELEIEDDGDFSLEIDVKSKVRVRGAAGDDALRIAGDFMQAMQAFTAELFSTLQGLFSPQPEAKPATTPAGAPAQPAAPLPATTPAPQPAPLPAPLPAPVMQAQAAAGNGAPATMPAAVTAEATAAATADVAAAAPALTQTSPAAAILPRPRLQAAYVSMEMRVSLLADLVQRAERGDEPAGAARTGELTGLGARFERLAAALRPQGAPTLSDFLRTLVRPATADAPAALPLRATGGFVSTQA